MRRFLLVLICSSLIPCVLFAQQKQSNDPWKTVWVNKPNKPLPTGVSHRTYYSQSMNCDVGFCIYLPPTYETEQSQRFPVIYYLHGGNGDELKVLAEAEFLHQQVIAGTLPPFVMVMPNGGKGSYFADSVDGKVMSETTIIKELIPHIDMTFRTIATRNGRCIQGFSMGAVGATKLACKYPELFCSLSAYAGGMRPLGTKFREGKIAEGGGYSKKYLGDDLEKWDANDSFALLNKNLDQIKDRMTIKLMCGTDDPDHLSATREFHQELTKLGVAHSYTEVPDMGHTPDSMRKLFAATWLTQHVEAMKKAK